jgi:hypothetical protein
LRFYFSEEFLQGINESFIAFPIKPQKVLIHCEFSINANKLLFPKVGTKPWDVTDYHP